MKNLVTGRKTIKLQLWNTFKMEKSSFDVLSKKLSNVAFSQKYAEKLITQKRLTEQSEKQARLLVVDFFNGQEVKYGFKTELESLRTTVKGGRQ